MKEKELWMSYLIQWYKQTSLSFRSSINLLYQLTHQGSMCYLVVTMVTLHSVTIWSCSYLLPSRSEKNAVICHIDAHFIQCRNDAYEVLVNTIVSPIRRSLQELWTSSLIVVHSTQQKGVVKSIMLCPKTVDIEQLLQFEQTANGRWSMWCGSFIKDLLPMFDMMCTKKEIRCYRSISSFNEFHIGNLEFLANQARMKHSSSK